MRMFAKPCEAGKGGAGERRATGHHEVGILGHQAQDGDRVTSACRGHPVLDRVADGVLIFRHRLPSTAGGIGKMMRGADTVASTARSTEDQIG
jgi:hypothetical protein